MSVLKKLLAAGVAPRAVARRLRPTRRRIESVLVRRRISEIVWLGIDVSIVEDRIFVETLAFAHNDIVRVFAIPPIFLRGPR